ncbi:MAG: hypothetical protein ACI4IV_01495 [Acutalibacteraceae bacterium]
MSMIKCSECGNKVPKRNKVCHHCGHIMSEADELYNSAARAGKKTDLAVRIIFPVGIIILAALVLWITITNKATIEPVQESAENKTTIAQDEPVTATSTHELLMDKNNVQIYFCGVDMFVSLEVVNNSDKNYAIKQETIYVNGIEVDAHGLVNDYLAFVAPGERYNTYLNLSVSDLETSNIQNINEIKFELMCHDRYDLDDRFYSDTLTIRFDND